MPYKKVIYRIIAIITEVNPDYPHAKTFASLLVEGALHQYYLKEHFQTITNLSETNSLSDFYTHMIKKTLQ
jgi:hypothetical protein